MKSVQSVDLFDKAKKSPAVAGRGQIVIDHGQKPEGILHEGRMKIKANYVLKISCPKRSISDEL